MKNIKEYIEDVTPAYTTDHDLYLDAVDSISRNLTTLLREKDIYILVKRIVMKRIKNKSADCLVEHTETFSKDINWLLYGQHHITHKEIDVQIIERLYNNDHGLTPKLLAQLFDRAKTVKDRIAMCKELDIDLNLLPC